MAEELTVAQAREILEVGDPTDVEELTRCYRRRALQLHPDAGGSPDAFHRLQVAYDVLRRELDPGAPARPLRRGAAGYSRNGTPRPVDPDGIDWDADATGTCRLTRDRLAVRTGRRGPVARTVARSRGPRSLLNPLVPMLSPDLSSTLLVRPEAEGVGVVLQARGRMRRRVLDARLASRWTRTQESRTVTAVCRLPAGPDRRVNAVRATDTVVELLEALSWPLGAWRLETESASGA